MKWIDEMFADIEKDRHRLRGKQTGATSTGAKHPKSKIPGVLNAWKALVSSISNDANDFNNNKKRAGQSVVRMSQSYFECEVYLPGMHSRRMVLTLDNNALQVSVHPDFPNQQLTITIEPDKESKHGFWVLGEITEESVKLSAQQLSEYLLKPLFASANVSGEP